MIGQANLHTGLYYLHDFNIGFKNNFVLNIVLNCNEQHNIDLCHYRSGHPDSKTIEYICRIFPYVHFISKISCDTCHFVTQHKLPFQQSNTCSLNVFNLTHVDIWGHIRISSIHGHKYFLTIVDDHTRHTWIYLMKSKIDTRNLLCNFFMYAKKQFNLHIKIIRYDNGKEFDFIELYDKLGILHKKILC